MRDIVLKLSLDERNLLIQAIWHLEDQFRLSRLDIKFNNVGRYTGTLQSAEAGISRTVNLKRRLFRATGKGRT